MCENLFIGIADLIYSVIAWIGLPVWIAALIVLFLKWLAIVLLALVNVTILVWLERKICGFIQLRLGPNRLGPAGVFQTAADALKLMGKEDIIPQKADKVLFILAPAIFIINIVIMYAVVPFGKGLTAVDFDCTLLFFIAVGAIGTFCLFMAGWGSNNKWSLIGAMRAVAQMISYEIPMAFSLLGVVMITGSLNINTIVEFQQEHTWMILLQPLGFLLFFISATAELNRGPFDTIEGEQELIAGPYTEYTGMRYALFYLGEYISMVASCLVISAVFFGGWAGPGFLPSWIWMMVKAYFFILVFFWIKWTFPRIRMDHLMEFSWKVLIPVSLLNILLTGIGITIFM